MLFAATYPERVSALVLWGAMARSTADDDYPWAPSREAAIEANDELVAPLWGQGATIEIFSPSLADDRRAREFQARFERQAASPMRVDQLFRMFLDTDVRDALPLIHAPTAVLHRRHDRAVNYRAGTLAGRADRGQPLRRARGRGPLPLGRRQRGGAGRDRGVPHRRPPRPGARAGARHGPLHRHRRLDPASRPRSATAAGAACSTQHQALVRRQLAALPRAARSRPPATASSPPSTGRPGLPSARGRSPPRCPRWASRCGPACTPARSS